jgi:hypothetical protein
MADTDTAVVTSIEEELLHPDALTIGLTQAPS